MCLADNSSQTRPLLAQALGARRTLVSRAARAVSNGLLCDLGGRTCGRVAKAGCFYMRPKPRDNMSVFAGEAPRDALQDEPTSRRHSGYSADREMNSRHARNISPRFRFFTSAPSLGQSRCRRNAEAMKVLAAKARLKSAADVRVLSPMTNHIGPGFQISIYKMWRITLPQ